MTDIKIEGKLPSSAGEALGEHARALFDKPGSTRVGIVELRSAGKYVPSPGEDTKPYVKVRIAALEIATRDQENDVRRAQRALYLERTARGTLTEDGQIELSQDVVRLLGDHLEFAESARLRAGLEHWTNEMSRVANSSILTDGEIRHEVDRIREGLQAVLHPARVQDDE